VFATLGFCHHVLAKRLGHKTEKTFPQGRCIIAVLINYQDDGCCCVNQEAARSLILMADGFIDAR
jgi:hypothetical protein